MTRAAPSRNALLIANRPTGPQPQTATVSPGRMLAVLRGLVAGREDVGQEQHLLVAELAAHLDRTDVGIRHARVLGLPAGVAADEMRIAEDGGGRVAPHLLGHPGVRVRVLAQRKLAALAEIAVAARDRERHDDAIADLQVLHRGSDFDDLAHELVAEDVAFGHRRDATVVQMQIGSADGGGLDPHDRIARIEDLRIGNALDANVVLAVPAGRSHVRPPLRSIRYSMPRRPAGCPSVVAISPVSITARNRRRSC